MTCILIGHKYKKHRLGTVYGATTLDSVATGINANGTFTVNLPASPSAGQIITINNTGSGTVTVSGNGNNIGAVASITLADGISGQFYWDGYTWGVWYQNNSVTALSCAASVLNATHDFGTTTQGPAETPYSVPADTVEYSGWWVNACGETVRRVITTIYDGRGPTAAEGGGGYTYTNAVGVSGILVSSAAAVWAGFYASMPNLTAYSSWNICPTVNQAGGTNIYAYNEPSYDAPDVNGNITIRDNTMMTSIAGHDITCSEVAGRVDVPFAVYYLPNYSRVVALAANAYYLDTHIIWTYETL